MSHSTVRPAGLLLMCALLVASCTTPVVTPSPSPTPSATATPTPPPTASPAPSPAPSPSPTRATTPLPTVARPSPTALPTPSGPACPRQTGGNEANTAQLVVIRFGSQPGADRLVFEFDRASGLPLWAVEQATQFIPPSGQPVAVDGNAHLSVNLRPILPHGSYTGPTTIRPGGTVVRELKLVEHFESVMVWGVGLERPSCPRILELSGPARLVVDLPH